MLCLDRMIKLTSPGATSFNWLLRNGYIFTGFGNKLRRTGIMRLILFTVFAGVLIVRW